MATVMTFKYKSKETGDVVERKTGKMIGGDRTVADIIHMVRSFSDAPEDLKEIELVELRRDVPCGF